MTFGEQVKFVREKLYLSQESLAKELKVSFSSVNRWESKGIEPRWESKRVFYSFCEARGIKIPGIDLSTSDIINKLYEKGYSAERKAIIRTHYACSCK